MKNVITAIDNSEINEKLKKEKNIKIISKDILYKEGILEQIEENKKINLIIIKEKLDGEILIKELIKKIKSKIKNIEIIIITENKNKLIEEIKKFKNIKIYETKKIKIKKLVEVINSEKKENFQQIKTENEKTIITISGSGGTGKTITTYIFSEVFYKKDKIIIDYNPTEEQDLKTLLKIDKNEKFEQINKNLKIVTSNETESIKKILELKNFNNVKNKEKEIILKRSKKNIILLEPNILGIKKCKKIIKYYLQELKINKKEILILINKKNENSIDKKIIENIFKEIKIVGEIKNSNKYEKIINNNLKNIKNILSKEEKNNIENILDSILEK